MQLVALLFVKLMLGVLFLFKNMQTMTTALCYRIYVNRKLYICLNVSSIVAVVGWAKSDR